MQAQAAPNQNGGSGMADIMEGISDAFAWLTSQPDGWLLIGIAVLAFIGLTIARYILLWILEAFDKKYGWQWDSLIQEALARTGNLFLLILSVYIASRFAEMPEGLGRIIISLTVIATVVQAAIWATFVLSAALTQYAQRRAEHDNSLTNALSLIKLLIRIVVWSVALLFVLDNLGINVTALVAGLGIGGIAIGLAAQGIIQDLFGSLSIVLDKPFVTGDFIVFGDMMGNVERIGLKTTRIRSLSGEQIVVSNADLLSTRIRNYKRMEQRRVVFPLGVVYQTPHEKLQQIPEIIRSAVEDVEMTRFDRSHFQKFGDFALVFETVYYVLSSDYAIHMDIQQQINLRIYREFEARGIEFAYPTQTVMVQPGPGFVPPQTT